MELLLIFLSEEEQYQRAYLERILGVTWDKDVVKSMFKTTKGPKGATGLTVHIPLALLLRPEFSKELQTLFQAGKRGLAADVPDDAVSLGDLSKQDFLSLLRGAAGMVPKD